MLPPILFVGGKGGVGKSTMSSALACLLARDSKTLLVSTDPAHSLSDIFEVAPSSQTQQVHDNLFVREIDPLAEVKAYAAQVAKDAKQFISAASYSLLESYYDNVAQSGVAQESALFD
ncbi:MAG: arsenical pump-driving ATPase GET3, partial [Helicobacter sp.]|nr:arsenical pump-driving ATPase GET3 [Helicobacter sp.]